MKKIMRARHKLKKKKKNPTTIWSIVLRGLNLMWENANWFLLLFKTAKSQGEKSLDKWR